jgi:SPP1 family predicted phage head-tail adaptor
MTGDPGSKDRKIVIQQRTDTNTNGDVVTTWATLATVWADVRPLRMSERYSSEAKHSERVNNFRIYFRSDVTPTMRISYDGLYWRITGIAEVNYRDELDITAEAIY